MTQRRNGQAPIVDPDLMRMMMQSQQGPPASGFAHSHGTPSPCPTVLHAGFPVGDKMLFYSTGGLTTFETAALKVAESLVGCVAVDDIPDEAVKLLNRTLELCRKTQDPYQGIRVPPPPSEEKPAIITE
jgi:hypothetical protein